MGILLLTGVFLLCFFIALAASFVWSRLYYRHNRPRKKYQFFLSAEHYQPEREQLPANPALQSIDNDSALQSFIRH